MDTRTEPEPTAQAEPKKEAPPAECYSPTIRPKLAGSNPMRMGYGARNWQERYKSHFSLLRKSYVSL